MIGEKLLRSLETCEKERKNYRGIFTYVTLTFVFLHLLTTASGHIKPCATLKAPIQFELQVCAPDGNGGFTEISVQNCQTLLEECVEFNRASCEWLNFTGSCNFNILMPTCRLKYKAKLNGLNKLRPAQTWISVHYANQYGSNGLNGSGIRSVVELHRALEHNFEGYNQNDWPESVYNDKTPGGYSWTRDDGVIQFYQNVSINSSAPLISSPLCQNGSDDNNACSEQTRNLIFNYQDRLDRGDHERYILDYNFSSACIVTIDDKSGSLTDVCRVKIKEAVGDYFYSKHTYEVTLDPTKDLKVNKPGISVRSYVRNFD